ncbi:uncharacterized protein METZ01_LOCUS355881 [marine metagenome]|uniref:Uncharacterized protein n=1 Tax=marine metagenome TaxID=408172 RepID=A0A382S1C4_9ZZZZ
MKNFLHLYRFGQWLSEQGFNVIHPIKQADASWMQMLGIASSKELNIMMEHYYHFQAPIKAYSPRDVIKKLQDGISAYGLRINSKLDVNSKRTAESEKTIDISWYDMYRHKHLWYKNVLDIGPDLHDDILSELEFATDYFNQTEHYCPKCGCICIDQAMKSRVKLKPLDQIIPIPPPKPPPPSDVPKRPPPTIYNIINNFVCENCTYSRVRKHEKDKEEIIVEEKF